MFHGALRKKSNVRGTRYLPPETASLQAQPTIMVGLHYSAWVELGKRKPLWNSFIIIEPLTAEFIGSQQSRRSPCLTDTKKLRNEPTLTSFKILRGLLLLNKYCC